MVNIWSIFSQLAGGGCPLCRQPGDEICLPCRDALPFNHHPCPRCALPMPDTVPAGTQCADCQARSPAFERALAPLQYLPPVDDLVAQFKYHRHLHLGRMLAGILADAARSTDSGIRLLLPVPLQAQRLQGAGIQSGRGTGPLAVPAARHPVVGGPTDQGSRQRSPAGLDTRPAPPQRARGVRVSRPAATPGRTDRRCDDHGRHGRGGLQGPAGRRRGAGGSMDGRTHTARPLEYGARRRDLKQPEPSPADKPEGVSAKAQISGPRAPVPSFRDAPGRLW